MFFKAPLSNVKYFWKVLKIKRNRVNIQLNTGYRDVNTHLLVKNLFLFDIFHLAFCTLLFLIF